MHELLTPAETANADRLAGLLGVPIATLMENAGRAVARAVRARIAPCRTLVLCGPGNNGGDGYAAARHLAQAGWPVAVAATAAPRRGSEAAAAAVRFVGPRLRFGARAAGRASLVIDAVFGAGLARDVDGVTAETLRAARRLVAVDVPSGLDGTTGATRGYAPQAELTVTFFRFKPGHLLLPGRDLCGELVLADIGLPAAVLGQMAPRTFRNTPALFRLPAAAPRDHKYARGAVAICGGPMEGAARLAAAAARRAGAGVVVIATTLPDAYRAAEPGVIVDARPLAEQLADSRRLVWVCGPGLGANAAGVLRALLAAGRQVVVDADALAAAASFTGAAVLTPHEGEFARVFGPPGTDRLAAVRAAAAKTGAVVLLKGSDTIVAAPDGRAAINANAPPWLATAGSGDVLAGTIGAMLAQGLPPFDAACAGVYLHGEAGTLAGPGLIAEDLPPRIAQAATALRHP